MTHCSECGHRCAVDRAVSAPGWPVYIAACECEQVAPWCPCDDHDATLTERVADRPGSDT